MRYQYNIDYKKNVNVVGDYSTVSYVANLADPGVPEHKHIKATYRGDVKVSPHDVDPAPAIRQDVADRMDRDRIAIRGTGSIEFDVLDG